MCMIQFLLVACRTDVRFFKISFIKMSVSSKKFILAKHFLGKPKEGDLKLVVETLPVIADGGKPSRRLHSRSFLLNILN